MSPVPAGEPAPGEVLLGVRGSAADEDWEGVAHHHMQMMWDHLSKGSFAEVLDLAPRARWYLERGFNLRWYTYALGAESLANSWRGRWQRAVEIGQEALEVAKKFSDDGSTCYAGAPAAPAAYRVDDVDGPCSVLLP